MAGTDKHARIEMKQDGQDDDEHNAKLLLVDEAIHSEFFWAYLHMLHHIAELQREAVRWVNSCSCHWGLDFDAFPPQFQKLWLGCPPRGRRCHDMATDEFFDLVKRLFETRAARLARSLPAGLTTKEKREILEDFEHGKLDIVVAYTLKCTNWDHAPWITCGLAHRSPAVRVVALEKTLQSESPHPLSRS